MSAVTSTKRVVDKVDTDIGGWLGGLITGKGSSPSQIIVAGVCAMVPGVGQVMDARDLVMGIIVVIRSPAAIAGWVDLVITLIGCVPFLGDALKTGFKLMKSGKSFGRVLEAASPKVRGNVQRYLSEINWSSLAKESKKAFLKSIDCFIDGLDNWAVEVALGRHKVAHLIDELKSIRELGPKMIDDALAELKTLHGKMLGHELPKNTAKVTPPAQRVTPQALAEAAERERVQAERIRRKLAAKKAAKEKASAASANKTVTDTKKAAQPKKKKWRTGIPAEHITDYYARRKHINFSKAKNYGILIEEHSDGHNGLDHLWSNSGGGRRFVVGETKSSIFDAFPLMAALPADLQAAFSVLRAEEKENRTTSNNKPNIFESEGRDEHENRRIAIENSKENEIELRKSLAKPNEETGLAAQMSHLWIKQCLKKPAEKLTTKGKELKGLIKKWEDGDIDTYPYNRWVFLVTGRQLHKHRQSGGSAHDVQTVLSIPDNILAD